MPCDRMSFAFSKCSRLFITMMPPSPVLMFLFEKKLKQPMSPRVPSLRPRNSLNGP